MRASSRSLVLLAVVLLFLSACKSELYTDLSEREANRMVAALLDAGIPADKSRTGANSVSVMVDSQRFAEAMAILTQRGLPSASYESLGDVFQKEGIVSSPIEERARFIHAMSQELGRTVAEIDGVLSARVHVVLPESDMLGRDLKPSSAAVFIRHSADIPVDGFTPQIKMLIANSLEGLVYDNVTVVSVPARVLTAAQTSSQKLERVLGIWVHSASVARLWSVIVGLFVLMFAAVGIAAYLYFSANIGPRLADRFGWRIGSGVDDTLSAPRHGEPPTVLDAAQPVGRS